MIRAGWPEGAGLLEADNRRGWSCHDSTCAMMAILTNMFLIQFFSKLEPRSLAGCRKRFKAGEKESEALWEGGPSRYHLYLKSLLRTVNLKFVMQSSPNAKNAPNRK